MAHEILGVWLRAKVECPKDKTIIETGTWSNWSRVFIHATCPTCGLSCLMHVKEIERAPEETRVFAEKED